MPSSDPIPISLVDTRLAGRTKVGKAFARLGYAKLSALKTHWIPLVVLALGLISTGCDTGPKPDAQLQANNLKTTLELRSYFDKAHGDYTALSPEDKAAFAKLVPGKNPETVFNAMKGPGPKAATKGTSGGVGTPGG